jgi:hypothetical protein
MDGVSVPDSLQNERQGLMNSLLISTLIRPPILYHFFPSEMPQTIIRTPESSPRNNKFHIPKTKRKEKKKVPLPQVGDALSKSSHYVEPGT